jgi:hypothetical protein
MIGLIFRMAGLPANPARIQLEEYASRRVLVVIHPVRAVNNN